MIERVGIRYRTASVRIVHAVCGLDPASSRGLARR